VHARRHSRIEAAASQFDPGEVDASTHDMLLPWIVLLIIAIAVIIGAVYKAKKRVS